MIPLLKPLVKRILLEGKASSFLKFYYALKTPGNFPDNHIIFDCLMSLKEYYEEYLTWYEKYPNKKKEDMEVYPYFVNRLKELNQALNSSDIKKKIIAVDNGINQWHIDFPVIYHLQTRAENDLLNSDDKTFQDEMNKWSELEDILIKLGKLPKQSPYKRKYNSL